MIGPGLSDACGLSGGAKLWAVMDILALLSN
jgi:hypothetical protein